MRRLLQLLLGLSWLGLVGCGHYCTHGACDCWLDDHCCTRAPWVYQRAPVTLGAPVGAPEVAPPPVSIPPAPMPPAKELPKHEE
jgi:hypothetical protein